MNNITIATGDVFALGEHRLLVGDSLDAPSVGQFLSGETIDLILTDPPFGVAYVEGKKDFGGGTAQHHDAILNDHTQSHGEYRTFTKTWLEAAKQFLARKNALYCFGSDKMLFALRDGMLDAGFRFGQLLIWLKTSTVVGRLDYQPQTELIFYGWHGVHAFHKPKDKNVLICPKTLKNDLHPTMKPISLLRRLILNSSRIGDTIYDPFGGSGSTLIAAEDTKRRCVMIETDPKYCRVILERFEKHTGVKAVPLSNVKHAR